MNKYISITLLIVSAFTICTARVIDQVHPENEASSLTDLELEDSFGSPSDPVNQDLHRQKRFVAIVNLSGGNRGYRGYGYDNYRRGYYGVYNRGYGGYGRGYNNYGGYGIGLGYGLGYGSYGGYGNYVYYG